MNIMQKEFVPLLKEATAECRRIFKDNFRTAYLHGSIALNDAVPYISDLDYYLVVSKDIDGRDSNRLAELEAGLQSRYPVVNGVHINAHSTEELRRDMFSRFILRYNSVVYSGGDIVREMENEGCDRLFPNADTAKMRLGFARQCFSEALGGGQPSNTGEIPSDTFYAARKYARYFAVIEGAYFLMSQGRFSTFEKENVISELRNATTGFEDILDITERVLYDPVKAGVGKDEYLKTVRPLVEWMFEKIQNA